MSEEMRKKELRKPISEQELERRFKAVRQAMEKEKLDCLIMQNNNQFIGGYTRYFTGLPATSYAHDRDLSIEHRHDDHLSRGAGLTRPCGLSSGTAGMGCLWG